MMIAMTSPYANALANRQPRVIALKNAPRTMALRWLVAIKRAPTGQEGIL